MNKILVQDTVSGIPNFYLAHVIDQPNLRIPNPQYSRLKAMKISRYLVNIYSRMLLIQSSYKRTLAVTLLVAAKLFGL